MKLRLVLKTITNDNKEVELKFNIAPSKHIGFINFINLCMNQDNPVKISFEKISKTGEKEASKVSGEFKFSAKDKSNLKALEQEAKKRQKKKK